MLPYGNLKRTTGLFNRPLAIDTEGEPRVQGNHFPGRGAGDSVPCSGAWAKASCGDARDVESSLFRGYQLPGCGPEISGADRAGLLRANYTGHGDV